MNTITNTLYIQHRYRSGGLVSSLLDYITKAKVILSRRVGVKLCPLCTHVTLGMYLCMDI